MPYGRARIRVWSVAATVTALLGSGSAATAQQTGVPVQTLCVLDFHRLGDDTGADWLEQGLADMMIGTMHTASPYLVVERRHLKQILAEHGLAEKGLLDINTAVRGASLAKAHLLLQGSFALKGNDLTVQARLIRVSDQQVLAQTVWTDRYANVLAAPRVLSEQLQAGIGSPIDPARFEGIEAHFPTTIDVAKSYYQGVRAFDEGHYPEALGHYLDAAQRAGDFRRADPAVLEMYYLLGRSEHAVLFARNLARLREDKGDVPGALEYYFAAAQTALDPLGDLKSTSELLTQLLRVAESHERKTGEIAATKTAILKRIDDLLKTGAHKDPTQLLADREIRHQIWIGEIDGELDRRVEEQARGGFSVLEDGTWVKRFAPPPSVLMWKIRAHRTLARTHARLGNITSALDQYRMLLNEYEFLAPVPHSRLVDSIKTEAHFMWLRHYATTGRLIRDHTINQINKLNGASGGMVFRRNFGRSLLSTPDARARVASRGEGQGHEYFDFAAPPGQQIDSVSLKAHVDGIAEFGFSLPQPVGWPPQYSFSRRFEHFKFVGREAYERKVVLPPGTEFFSVGTSWGPGLYSNTWAELTRRKMYASNAGPDLISWEISFAISPKSGVKTATASAGETRPDPALPDPAPRALMSRYAAGWDRGYLVRQTETSVYAGNPRLDVYAEKWLVFSLDGDIRIFQQRNPRVEIDLPVTINSRAREFDASLVRTHDGGYALLWARGTSKRHADRFVAFSTDLLRWQTPQRLVFEAAPDDIGYTYSQLEPLERTFNVVAVRKGYAMLLAQGFVRLSENLRHWGPPRKAISQDLDRNRLFKGPNGVAWAVYENSSPELQPYTEDDWLHGHFVTDGKRYRHVTELRVSRSTDGIEWKDAGKLVVPGQPSGLWAFPIDERQIGIAAGFNNMFVKWFTASDGRGLTPIDSRLQLFNQSDEAEFFVRDGSLTCIRPLFDGEGQKPMLLSTSTGELW